MQQKLIRIFSVMLITVILCMNSSTIATYAAESYRRTVAIEDQGTSTNNENVEFDVYYAEGKHSKTMDVASVEEKLYLEIKVKNAGYLESAQIDLSDCNFNIANDETNYGKVQEIDTVSKLVTLNKIAAGNTIKLVLNISPKKDDLLSPDVFDKDSTVKFSGIYINENAKQVAIKKDVIINAKWHGQAKIELSQEVTKYIPFDLDKEKGVLVQTKINLSVKDSLLPVKSTKIEVSTPIILNEKPEKVIVYSTGTMATNGENTGMEFNKNNYNYNDKNGMLTISVDNKENNNGFIKWEKSGLDEYFITYVYSSNIYEQVKDKDIDITSNTIATCELYNDEKTEVSADVKLSTNCTNKIGKMININADIKEDVAKGYIYSNKIAVEENKNETIYNLQYKADISYAELIDKLTIEEKSDKFISEDGSQSATTVAGNNYVYDKLVTVNKENIQKILGDEGYLNIIFNENIIETINKDSKVNDEGNIVIDISDYNANTIKIETSKPTAEGMLIINIEKAASKNIDYSINQLEKFKQLNSSIEGAIISKNINIETLEANDSMNLVEPTSKAILSINKENLSTVVKNENVEIKAILETDSADDILYKNPTLYINLPKCVSNVDIKSVKPLYEDELTIKSTEIVDMGDYKSIKVEVEGTQTKYNDSTSKGLSILIYADIDVNRATPSIKDTITMIYTNENDKEESNTVSTELDFSSPKSVVLVNSISDYSTNGEEITLTNDEEETAQLDIFGDEKIATVKGQIINNYDNTISDVKILGRIPNKESANYDSTELMENTFDTILNGAINLTGLENGYTIYYSENNGANTDINDTNNGWTTTISDYSLVKSYLIVIDNELAKSTNIEWTYGLKIPADLGYKNTINNNYKVYLKNNLNSGDVSEEKMSPPIRLETEKGPELDVKLVSEDVKDGETLTNGMQILYNVTIKNTGSKAMNNVKVRMPIPEGMEYTDLYIPNEIDEDTNSVNTSFENIEPGETIVAPIKLNITKACSSKVVAFVYVDEFEGYIKTNEINIKIEDAEIALINGYYETGAVTNGDRVKFFLIAKNLTNQEINNITIEYSLPKNIVLNNYKIPENLKGTLNYDSSKGLVTIKLPKLQQNDSIQIDMDVTINNIEKSIKTKAKTTVNNKEYVSNTVTIDINKADFSVDAIRSEQTNVKYGDQIISQFKIENTGNTSIYDTNIKYNVPSGVKYISGTIEYDGNNYDLVENKQDENSKIYTIVKLEKGKTATITINLMVDSNKKDDKILSSIVVTNPKLGEKKSPILTYIVSENSDIGNNTENNDINNGIVDPGDGEQDNYKINGKVWIDANKNGEFDNNEEIVSGLTVVLINRKTDDIQTTTITNNNGRYTIDNLENGEYMVAFLYDSSVYTITEYQKSGVSSALNSDAIKSTIKYNGKDTIVGLTNTIQIENSDITNIDIGIYESDKFDLSLKKYVNKITINNDIGVVTYNYQGQNKTLAKVDIPAKQMDSSTIIIEYKLVVKNEGTVSGYAKKIVDYLPNDLKFSSELNKKAYIGKDGNIYSEELSQTEIKPGESKEIILVLTKQMTGENTGTIVNKAEIAEDYNELGLKDINSTPGNNEEKENDLSYANAIITVKTGQVIIYTTLTTIILAILIFGIYEIRKYVIKN